MAEPNEFIEGFTLGELHNSRTFDLLNDATQRRAPFDEVDLVALRAASGEGCTFELESGDGSEFMRLYGFGLVSMAYSKDDGWPHAVITSMGVLVLEAAEAAVRAWRTPAKGGAS